MSESMPEHHLVTLFSTEGMRDVRGIDKIAPKLARFESVHPIASGDHDIVNLRRGRITENACQVSRGEVRHIGLSPDLFVWVVPVAQGRVADDTLPMRKNN